MVELVVSVVVVTSYLAAGTVAWQVRPRNRIGPLMMAVGASYFACREIALVHEAKLFGAFWLAVFAQLAIALPTGRLTTMTQRVLVGSVYAYLTLLTVNQELVQHGNYTLYGYLPDRRWMNFLLGMASVIEPAVRWWRSSAVQRRLVAPVLGSCLLVIGLFVLDSAPTRLSEVAYPLALPLVPVAYLIGLLRQRLDRANVAGMVVRLVEAPRITDLAGELAAILHDPGVRLGFWAPGRGAYVTADGQPMPPIDDGATTRIDRGGRQIALLVHDKALLDEPELIEAACAATALALDNERLQADLRARLHELVASRARLVQAAVSGRRQLERDLHDGVQQRLLAVAMMLGRAEHTSDGNLVTEAKATVLATLDELRALCQGIHPPVLTERGLPGALRELADTAPIQVDVQVGAATGLSPEVESVAYYVAAEALANAVKHANTNHATVSVDRRETRLVVRVTDRGSGGADSRSGSGLAGLADRVEAIGGELVVSSPPGVGTTILAELPCDP